MFRKVHSKRCSLGAATNGETEPKAWGRRGKSQNSGGGCSDAGGAKAATTERSREGGEGRTRPGTSKRLGTSRSDRKLECS